MAHIAPAIVIWCVGAELRFEKYVFGQAIATAGLVYLTFAIVMFIDGLMSAGLAIYKTHKVSRIFPITSFVQVAKLFLYFFGAVIILSLMLGESPFTFIAGFGALTAVLMFVFKDPILGFTAGIQLTANRMVRVGDWVEMPKYGRRWGYYGDRAYDGEDPQLRQDDHHDPDPISHQ